MCPSLNMPINPTADLGFMKMALDLAGKGRGTTSPNPMVGAVVVKDGRVVGKGYHKAAGQPHAEVYALDDAGEAAFGATLYVTLEPCNHTGRTPPCTEKILKAGICRVVTAMPDPNPHVEGGGHAFLRSRGIIVETGVCETEASKLNEAFVKWIRTRRPFVLAKCAATLDGRIATRTGDAKWVSSEASRRHVHELRHWADAILVGIGTVAADDPQLTTRLENRRGRDPIRVILDTMCRISPDARVLRVPSDSDTILVVGDRAPADRAAALEGPRVRVLRVKESGGVIDLDTLIADLGQMQITSVLIEGGSRVFGSAIKAGVVDKVMFFYAPKILGGDDGIPICSGQGPELMAQAIPVRDVKVSRFDDDVMVEGYLSCSPVS
jgi:diaminohydroxyphosphoribosylaminopyrimidine deaminase / 5-amino-6-(5-phosphoribosylamino)uracil reductase